jgi:N-acylglucosamine 2-epimerase
MNVKSFLEESRSWIRNERDSCINFWLTHGMDPEYGGVYTCLDQKGEVYSTDKSVWMQGRCAWIFAYLCHVYGPRAEWLAASKSCLDFLESHCLNAQAQNRLYFTVTAEGKPLRQRRYFFSEAFYAMANAEYYGLTGENEHIIRARRAYDLYWELAHGMPDPTGLAPKTIPHTRSGRSFGTPMILLNVTSILLRTDPERKSLYEERARKCVDEIFRYHVKTDLGCLLENVDVNGAPQLYYTEGRTVNPGHDIEGAWFLLEHAGRTGDRALADKAAQIFDWAVGAGWDDQYGGLLYFTDCLNKPIEAYEHDMKLWWPHNELLIASMMIYRDTGKEKYLEWFQRALDYCKACFADPEHGEWYGYLRRDGKPTQPSVKGSTFKGPFHLPRMLVMVDVMIGEVLKQIQN